MRGRKREILVLGRPWDNLETASDLDRVDEGLLVIGPEGESVHTKVHAIDLGGRRQDHVGLGCHGGGVEDGSDIGVGHVGHQNLRR